VVAAVVVVALVVGVWFFVLRGDGGATSQFLAAHDRFVAATQASQDALAQVERFAELETFDATVNTERIVMHHQLAVFDRLAKEQSGDDARLASEASAAGVDVLVALDSYAAAVLDRRLLDAAFSKVQMQTGVAKLDAVAAEWKKLQ
jgi:hypothetical protein